ncbi:MAG: glycogen synthase GlgA [Verrucomicrobia bacterium]|nr:glycogen synthase GlgA [Verrucomicrobiota bacterium]
MRVLYAASEIMPFASTGGLADVGAGLPKALLARNTEISRIMPLYRRVAEGGFALKDTGLRLDIPVGFQMHQAEVWYANDPPPRTYFIRRDEYFDRSQLYSLPERDYDDNFDRFVFFQKAIVSLIDTLQWHPDVVHCSDWQTGLVPLFLRHGLQGSGRKQTERTVFTIHNLAYQGLFPGLHYSLTNLPFYCFNMDCAEFYGSINCIKAGITSANLVTTVSHTYAQEIRTEEYGCGLHDILAQMGGRLAGVVHGVDYSLWNPAVDPHLAQSYEPDNLDGKKTCKEELIRLMGLTIAADAPLIGMVTRLVDQKGLDILAEAMPKLMKADMGFVLLGAGQDKYQKLCLEWASLWPGRFAARLGYDNPLSHKIEAGADIYMMPSRFEPCGLNQLYSLKYGTIPIVHTTGGLDDTIQDIDSEGREGTGFKFRTYTPEGLLHAVNRALALYRRREIWTSVVRRAMAQDFSWDRAAEEYLRIYQQIMS